MNQPPETVTVTNNRVSCDGAAGIRSNGRFEPSALGHPRVWMEIDERGYVECGYCDRRFVLAGSAHRGFHEASAGDLPGSGDSSTL